MRVILRSKYMLLICVFFFFLILLSAQVNETGSFYNFLFGIEPNCQYDHWVSHVAEGIASPGYNDYAPWDRQTNGFGSFTIPDSLMTLAWNNICAAFSNQNWLTVNQLINSYQIPYQLIHFIDTDTNREYYMLRELLNRSYDDNGTPNPEDDENGSFNLGWGLFVYNPSSNNPIIVTVVHPNDDYIAPPIAWKAFTTLNARFLLINGAGREVAYNHNYGYYSNNFSLSDPSRNPNHPFHIAYTYFCNNIRNLLNLQNSPLIREFSLQIHSYDSNAHIGYANIQVATGAGQTCVNLPTYDISFTYPDMINAAGYLIHPANTIGTNQPVYTYNYWAVYGNDHPIWFNDGVHQLVISNQIDLPAYSLNRQMLYTLNNWNNYDVYDPFLHVELDELPDSYPQNNTSKQAFYGFNAELGIWELTNRYTKTIAYYTPFINAMQISLDRTIILNDFTTPSTPVLIGLENVASNNYDLRWQRIFDYDFSSYKILYKRWLTLSDNNMILMNTFVYDRNSNPPLADQYRSQLRFNLVQGYLHTFSIAAVDKSGRESAYSDSITIFLPQMQTTVADLTFVREMSDNAHICLIWTPVTNPSVIGYRLERRRSGINWQVICNLSPDTNQYIDDNFTDNDLEVMEYRIGSLLVSGTILYPQEICQAWLRVYQEPILLVFEHRENRYFYLEWEPVNSTLGGLPDLPDYYEITKSSSPYFDTPETDIIETTECFYSDFNPQQPIWQERCFYKVRAMARTIE